MQSTISPFRYQLSKDEFLNEFGISYPTMVRRREWAQRHYPDWYLVFLPNGWVDIQEYQKLNTAYATWKHEQSLDPRLRRG